MAELGPCQTGTPDRPPRAKDLDKQVFFVGTAQFLKYIFQSEIKFQISKAQSGPERHMPRLPAQKSSKTTASHPASAQSGERPATFAELKTYLAEHGDRLPKRLRQVATAVVTQPDDIAFSTAAESAERIGVQPSTLVRFAQALGYSGFSDLQAIFRSRLKERFPDYRERLAAVKGEGPMALFEGFAKAATVSFDRARSSLDPALVQKAADHLAKAETIYILAGRRAFPLAAYAAYACGKLGLRSILIDQLGGLGPEQAAGAGKKDAMLAISFSPYAPETIAITTTAHQRGVPVIAITDSPFSPLVPQSSVWLEMAEADYGAFRSLAATLALVMTLLVATAEARGGAKPD